MPTVFKWFGDRAKAAIRQEMDRRMDDAGKAIVAKAVELAPEDTGALKRSIGYVFDASTQTLTIHADMSYAAFIEFGHHTITGSWVPPQPFLRPALAAASDLFFTTSTSAVMDFGNTGEKYAAGMAAQHGGPHNFGSTARFGRGH